MCKSKIVMSSPTDRAYEGDVVRLTLENQEDINDKASQLGGKATPISYNTYVIDVYTGKAGSSAVVCTEAVGSTTATSGIASCIESVIPANSSL